MSEPPGRDDLERILERWPGVDADLARKILEWFEADPDPETRAELIELLSARDDHARRELADRFDSGLRFGTAGLRAPIGAGPNRMNRLVVRRASAGLARMLGPGGATVVVGRDARRRSEDFAEECATTLSRSGARVLVLPDPVPTPVVAFSVRHHGAEAGVMITASHNPPGDNGYKVYLGDGAQVVPPAADEIAAAIEEEADDPASAMAPVPAELASGTVEAYISWAAGTVASGPRDLRVVYTPLHGVGWPLLSAVFERARFPAPMVVPEQAAPDPEFPTVPVPNPEDPRTLDLAIALAIEQDAHLVVANDPDSDRLAVALPGPDGWEALSGDEIGALLADHVLATTSGRDRLVATTVVSSPLLSKLAASAGVAYAETLTGFKWIARAAVARPGARLVFGYEEALGFSVAPYVRDKDGITAALAFAALTARLVDQGSTPRARLAEIACEHGLHLTRSHSVAVAEPGASAAISAAMKRLRDDPPAEIAGSMVVGYTDYMTGVGDLPPADLVRFELAGGGRVAVRPSGTEPKLKIYASLVMGVPDGPESHAPARTEGRRKLVALTQEVESLTGLVPAPAR